MVSAKHFAPALAVFSLLLSGFGLSAVLGKMAVSDDYIIIESMQRVIAIEKLPVPGSIFLKFSKNQNGVIDDAQVQGMKLSLDTEAACLEALYASVREVRQNNPHSVQVMLVKENEFLKPDQSIAKFYKSHPRQNRDAVVHLIPLSLSGNFNENELRSISNLASLGSERKIALTKLKNIYADWAPILRSPQSYTKIQVINQARKVKKKYELREGTVPPEADLDS